MKRSSIIAILVLAASLGTADLAPGKFMLSAYKLAMLLIGLSGERSVTRYAAIVVSRLCLMTAASEGICTSIADPVFKSKNSQDSRRIGAKLRAVRANQREVAA
jgi:hypothetical protein